MLNFTQLFGGIISDVLLWSPTYGRAKAGRPAKIYIQQLCEDTEYSPEDLPEALTIGKSGERRSGISVLAARHDDDDDDFKGKARVEHMKELPIFKKKEKTAYSKNWIRNE